MGVGVGRRRLPSLGRVWDGGRGEEDGWGLTPREVGRRRGYGSSGFGRWRRARLDRGDRSVHGLKLLRPAEASREGLVLGLKEATPRIGHRLGVTGILLEHRLGVGGVLTVEQGLVHGSDRVDASRREAGL